MSSELEIINGNKKIIICFGGLALSMGGVLPFEFLNYLSSQYSNEYDLIFYIDKKQCWYHKGIENISNNIDETVIYLKNKISKYNYEKIVFMGTSAGGYASLLFGSLCNVNHVIAFIPQTILFNPIDKKYTNIKNFINSTTNYILYGNVSIKDNKDLHHISHCNNIKEFPNVKIFREKNVNLKELRDNGTIKKIIDNL